MKRCTPFFLASILALAFSPHVTSAQTIAWDGGGDGFSWNDPLNWDTDTLPGPNAHVIIETDDGLIVTHARGTTAVRSVNSSAAIRLSGGSLNLASTSVVNNDLTVSGGILTGVGDVTVTGTLAWSAGAMTGAGATTIAATGRWEISGPDQKTIAERIINNAGTAVWTGTGRIFSDAGRGTINNLAGAEFTIQSDADFVWSLFGQPPVFSNAGRFIKSGGFGVTEFNRVGFDNTGDVVVESGTLWLSGGGTNSGAILLQEATTLDLAGGSYTLASGTSVTGPGQVRLSGAITSLGSGADVTMQTVELAGGTITGPGQVAITTRLDWSAGGMDGRGVTLVDANANFTISGNATKILSRRTLDSAAVAIWSGTGSINSPQGEGVFISRGLFDVQSDMTFSGAGFGTRTVFRNLGSFVKSAGLGVNEFRGVSFDNGGGVRVASGTLRLASGGMHSGSFDIPADATLDFAGGEHTLAAGTSFDAIGPIRVSGGSVAASAGAAIVFDRLDLTGGVITGPGAFTIREALAWTAGGMTGPGGAVTAILEGATVSIAGAAGKDFSGRTLNNAGTIIWEGPGSITSQTGNAIFNNQSTGVFDIRNDTLFSWSFFNRPPEFNNEGVVIKSAGLGTSEIRRFPVRSSGTVEVRTGRLRLTGGYVQSTGRTVLAGGLLDIEGGFALPADGMLTVLLTGTGTGQFGRMAVSGTLTLGGTIDVDVADGFDPAIGDRFEFLTFASRQDTFSAFEGMLLGNDRLLTKNCLPTSITLGVVAQPLAPQLIAVAGGLGRTPEEFISPLAEQIPFDAFNIEISEPVLLLSSEVFTTGGESPRVVDLVYKGCRIHELRLSRSVPVGHWTRITLNVSSQIREAEGALTLWVAKLPDDVNQDGLVNVRDATRFGDLFRGSQPQILIDLNGDGRVNVRDATEFGNQWHGLGSATRPWTLVRLPSRPQ